ISETNQQNSIRSYLNKLNCNYIYFNKPFLVLSIDYLKGLINQEFNYIKLQIIFIFSSNEITQNYFDNILLNQSALYSSCDHCFPIINIFSISKPATLN